MSSTLLGLQNMAGCHSSQTNPLSFPDVCEIPLGNKTFCSSHAPQLLALKWNLPKHIQDLPSLRKGPSSHSLWHRAVSTFHQASVHTAENIQTEWIWNFSFPFFLCYPSGILILSAWNSQSLWLYLDNSHAENLQEKGSDFLHKLLVQQLNGWLLPLQKIYSSKRQLFTKGTHKHIKQLGLKVVSSRKVQKC